MSLFRNWTKNGQKDGQGKYLWSKSILQNRPTFGGKPKEGGASKKVLHAQKTFSLTNERAQHHEQVKMSDRKK